MTCLFALIFALALSGCATLNDIQQPAALDAYTKCTALDVVSTTAGLSMNVMHEVNPITRALYIHALGHVAGTVVPVIGLSIAGYYFLKWLDRSKATAVMAGITCVSVVHNILIIGAAK